MLTITSNLSLSDLAVISGASLKAGCAMVKEGRRIVQVRDADMQGLYPITG